MNLLQLNRQPKPHVHAQGDVCPLCKDGSQAIKPGSRPQGGAAA